jgi:hypothetical protein
MGFAWAGHRVLPPTILPLLFLVTWCIYATDRLLDARAGLGPSCRERHSFHWRHRRTLAPLAMAAAGGAAVLIVMSISAAALKRNSIVGATALAYISADHIAKSVRGPLLERLRRRAPRELLVGILFTAGCVLPAWPRPHTATWLVAVYSFWIPAFYFAAVAWLNCVCIGKWESMQNPAAWRECFIVAAAGMVLCMLASHATPRAVALLACGSLSAVLLAMLDWRRHRLTPLALRAAADLVLLTPLLLIPFAELVR